MTGLRELPIATPNICSKNCPSNSNTLLLTHSRTKFKKILMGSGGVKSCCSCFRQRKSMTSSRGTLVKRAVTSKLTILSVEISLLAANKLSLVTKSILFLMLVSEKLPTYGDNSDANHSERGLLMVPTEDTIGRSGLSSSWTFGIQ